MLKNVRTYQIAVNFHHQCRSLALPTYLKDQLLRSSSSIALNIAEGYGRGTPKDQRRFFFLALGSLRESQAALDLAPTPCPELSQEADKLGAHLFRLCHSAKDKN